MTRKSTPKNPAAPELARHRPRPLQISPHAAQLILEGLDKLGWTTAEVRHIVAALGELERVANLAARQQPLPLAPPAQPGA